MVGRDELDAELGHADLLDLFAHAQPLEQADVGRQQRFANVKARVLCLLEQHDTAALRGEQRGDRRAGRAAADHEHVAGFGLTWRGCLHG